MNSNPPVRIGILGVQHYHANFWMSAFLQSRDAEVIGIWEADEELARSFVQKHSVRAFASRDDLIAQCDAVAICSATVDHLPLVQTAATAGKAVLCEKPLASSLADCLQIKAVVERTGIAFMQSFPKRFDPVNREILEIVRSGALGRSTLCRVRHGHSHGLRDEFHRPGSWTPPDPEAALCSTKGSTRRTSCAGSSANRTVSRESFPARP